MAMTSKEYLDQINAMGTMPDYKQQVTQAYEAPVLKPLVNEAASLEAQYLPSLFEPFAKMGTTARDISPAAKLAMVGDSLSRLNSRIGANNSIQNYYGAQIGEVAGNLGKDWQNRNQNAWQMYNATIAQEQAQRDEEFRQQQLAFQKQQAAQAAAAARAATQQNEWWKQLSSSQQEPAQQTAPKPQQTTIGDLLKFVKTAGQVNYLRPDGTIGSRSDDPAINAKLKNYYSILQKNGYDVSKLAGGNPF